MEVWQHNTHNQKRALSHLHPRAEIQHSNAQRKECGKVNLNLPFMFSCNGIKGENMVCFASM
jgi:hypothetical protein